MDKKEEKETKTKKATTKKATPKKVEKAPTKKPAPKKDTKEKVVPKKVVQEKEAPKKVVKKEEDKPKLVEEVKLDKPKLHQFKIVEVVLFGLISLLFGIIIGQQSILMFSNNNSEEKIIAAYNEIKENFYKEVDDKGLINAAIKGMMDFLNEENSVFMNENETTAYNNDSAGEYDGYGLTVTQTEVGLTIIHVNDVIADKFSQINLPAVFTKINDKDITDYTLEDIVSYLKTTGDIKITFDDGKTVDLERQNIIMPTVKSEKMRDDLYYLKIGSFTNYTAKQIKEQVDALNSKNLIIDLRNNGGGLLDSLVDVSSIFSSKEQLIFKTKQKKDVTEYKTKGNGKDYNIVVLINEGSASAAEVLASFLSEQKDATLVGAKTFGKGTVQVLKELGNGSQIKYTVKEWITSKDKVVEKVGISPDIAEDDYDVQMDIALKEIYK